jgi:hypothetical protein
MNKKYTNREIITYCNDFINKNNLVDKFILLVSKMNQRCCENKISIKLNNPEFILKEILYDEKIIKNLIKYFEFYINGIKNVKVIKCDIDDNFQINITYKIIK